MIDKNLILRKMSELEEYLSQLSQYGDITISDYYSDWKIQRIVERTLQMMIETCINVATHIISDRKYRVPKSYADTFKVLFENEVIGKELYDSLDKMAKFRNIVVHDYDDIDAEIVISILKNNINDFPKYKDAIVNFLI